MPDHFFVESEMLRTCLDGDNVTRWVFSVTGMVDTCSTAFSWKVHHLSRNYLVGSTGGRLFGIGGIGSNTCSSDGYTSGVQW